MYANNKTKLFITHAHTNECILIKTEYYTNQINHRNNNRRCSNQSYPVSESVYVNLLSFTYSFIPSSIFHLSSFSSQFVLFGLCGDEPLIIIIASTNIIATIFAVTLIFIFVSLRANNHYLFQYWFRLSKRRLVATEGRSITFFEEIGLWKY